MYFTVRTLQHENRVSFLSKVTIFKLNFYLSDCEYLFCNVALVFKTRENYPHVECLLSPRQGCYLCCCCWDSSELRVSTWTAPTGHTVPPVQLLGVHTALPTTCHAQGLSLHVTAYHLVDHTGDDHHIICAPWVYQTSH